MNDPLPAGKLPPEMLDRLLKRFTGRDPRVLVGPHVGEDAAVIDMGERLLVAKTDPITFATEQIGRYLVHINANDIACMGARPRWLLVTCLLPEGKTDAASVDALFQDLSEACDELGITVCGGHTEVTLGLDRVLLVGQLLGEVARGSLVDKSRIRPGDFVFLTKGVAIEGSCVIARERGDFLEGRVPGETLARARNLLTRPGISVLKDAQIACAAAGDGLHGMHDPTEGGLWQGVRELAIRAGAGVEIQGDRVPVLPETQALCRVFGLDPMGLLASGALLIVADPSCGPPLIEAMEKGGVPCTRIGEIRPASEGLTRVHDDRRFSVPEVHADELIKALREVG
jgi:hydrogenase expression/formation protein HypE